ncbi:LuxR C-terminal-related transcriptional regulator [Jatrophihabitans sp. YIM 134969]
MTLAADVASVCHRVPAPVACCGPDAAAADALTRLDHRGWDRAAVVLVGGRGSGRTGVLRQVREQARRRGVTVSTQLFGRPRSGAWSPESDLPGSERVLLDAAVSRLRAMSATAPVLLVLDDTCLSGDDVHRFVGRLLQVLPARVSVLRVATTDIDGRSNRLPGPTHRAEEVVTVRPWCQVHAARHLDQLARPPDGVVRLRLLAQAAGNPLALTELGRRAADNPQWAHPGVPHIPLPRHLVETFAPGLPELPSATRELLAVAAAVRGDLRVVGAVVPDVDADPGWVTARDDGWLLVRGGRVHFRHPMLRAAAYHGVSPSRMRLLHGRIAAALAADDPRATWHRGAGRVGPDEALAAYLEHTATRLTSLGAPNAAIEVLSLAAALTPDPGDQARRRRAAAWNAHAIDEPAWARHLVGAPVPPEPEPEPTGRRYLRVETLAEATDDVYRTGRPARPGVLRQLVARPPAPTLRPLPEAATPTGVDGVDAALWLWASALLDPATHQEAAAAVVQDPHLTRALAQVAGATTVPRTALDRAVGKAALLLDETAVAIERLSAAADSGRRAAPERDAAEALVWALSDAGRLRDALAWAERIAGSFPRTVRDRPATAARVAVEVVGGWMSSEPAPGFRSASARFDPLEEPQLAVRLWRAEGAAAAAAGRHDDAWRHLRQLWWSDGTPHHAVLSDLAIGDLAAAAAHTGRVEEARSRVVDVASRHGDGASLRLRLALHRARALLAEDDAAEHHFRLALVHPGGATWPHERAVARLDYAEWLRRAQRPADARPQLRAAVAAFEAVGTPSWAERAGHELAAATGPRTPTHGLGVLTLQQRKIAELAAGGATNQEIADQLYLSVRTVTTHMTRVFRSLGIERRMHLRDALRALDREQGLPLDG